MDRMCLGVWTLLAGAPLACMSARNDTREEPRPDATTVAPRTVAASYVVSTAAGETNASGAAEPLGTGGTGATTSGGAHAGGHGGKNTRNGKDDHNTQ
ncbi:MAG TPA: hypothetical protein VMI54_05150 [Polyangiaceae bacterium]|nr:hypothetical protein [Polyangiaceae bacterium]